MQTRLKSKRIQAIIAIAIAALLVLSGAFAWYTFSQNRINTFELSPTAPNVNLHDDFAGGPEKDVYVENSGDFNVLVRVRLSELIKRGNDLTPADAVDEDDAWGWHVHTPSADGCDVCGFEAHNYFDWTMNGQKFYMPAHDSAKGSDSVEPLAIGDKEAVIDYAALLKDAFTEIYAGDQVKRDAVLALMDTYLGGDDTVVSDLTAEIANIPDTYTVSVKQYANQPESEYLRRLNEVRLTLIPSQIIMMQDWINGTTYGTPLASGDFWVMDADGWCYWANALAPNAATGQLLSEVNYKNNYSRGELTYKINVHLNATSLDGTSLATFFLVAEQNGGISDAAMILMFLASGEYIFGEDGEIYHVEGGGFYRKINKNNDRYVNYTFGEKVYVSPGSLPGSSGGLGVGGQFDLGDDGSITDGGSYQIEDIAIGDNGVPYYDVGGGVYLAPVDDSGNPDNSGGKYAIVHTGTDGQTGNDDDIGPVRAEGSFPQWYFVDIQEVTDGDVIEAGQKGSLIRANNEAEIPLQTFSVQQTVYRVQSITRGENGLLYLKLDEDLYAVALNAYANPVNLTMSETWENDETVPIPSTYYIIYPAESGKIGTENDTTDITPVISAQPVDISGFYGDTATTLSVTSSGAGAHTYQWYKDGEPIAGAVSNTLEVIDVADSGDYYCTIIADVKGHSFASVDTDIVAVAITARPITITAGSEEKIYDGNPLTKSAYTLTGTLASSDSLSVTVTGSITDNGTEDNVISATTITRAGTDVAANYDVTTVNGTLSVTKRPITITAGSASKTYDGTPLTHDNYSVTSGSVAGDDSLSVTVTGSITDIGDTDNVISAYTIKRSGTDVVANYNVTTVNGKLTIGTKTLSGVTVEVSGNYTYNGVAQMPTYTVKDGGTTLTNGTHFTAVISNNTNAGTATITINGTGNYSGEKTQNFTIAKAPLTIKAENKSVTYRDAIPAYTVTYSGLVNGEPATVLGGTLSYNCSYTATSNVDNYNITPQGLTSSNYAITFTAGTLTVNPKSLAGAVITVSSNHTYTGSEQTPTWNVKDGAVSLYAGTDLTYTITNHIDASTTAPTITITGKGNYTGTAEQNFTIAQKALTITANNQVVTYGNAAPAYTVAYSGFVGGQNQSVLGGTLAYDCTYTTTSNVDTYDIMPSGRTSTNYAIEFKKGTLTVNKRAITLTAGSATKEYDGTALTNSTYTLAGTLASTESVSSVTTSGTITDVGFTSNVISTYQIMRSAVDTTANYNVTTVNGTLTVTSPFTGKGTEAEPFLISTKADLEKLRDRTNANTNFTTGKYFEQTANIDLGGEASPWTPIGSNSNAFKGIYDGGGYTISGLYVYNPGGSLVGLFGSIGSSEIKNLAVIGAVSTDINAGRAGGIVGNSAGTASNYSAVTNCVFEGTVSTGTGITSGAGGIVGMAAYTNIKNCYVRYGSEIKGVLIAGGVVGQSQNGYVENSYSLAKVNVVASAGGVIGGNATGNSVTNCAFLRTDTLNNTLNASGSGAAVPTAIGYFSDLGSALTPTNGTTIAAANLVALLDAGAEGSGKAWIQYVSGGSWPLPATIRDKSLGDYNAGFNYAGGDGQSEATAYQIATKTQLKYMRDMVNAGGSYSQGVYFKQTANIDLGGELWEPIGKNNTQLYFYGTYDGGGYKISGLYIDNTTETSAGLFGMVHSGAIKNLAVEGNVINTKIYTGGIAGAAMNTTVSNCVFSGTVNSTADAVGGIVGVAVSAVTIQNCYVTYGSEISGASYIGGISGRFMSTNISINSCYSLAKVSGTTNVGGIGGNNIGTVSNSAFMKTDALNADLNAVGTGTGTTTNAVSFAKITDTFIILPATGDPFAGDLLALLNTDQTGTPWLQTNAGISWPVLSAINREHDGWDGAITGANIGYVMDNTLKTFTIQAPGALAYLTSELNNSAYNAIMNSFTFILANDIDLNGILWTPIGTSSAHFKTTFDGNGYTIKGLNVQTTASGSGLFGIVGEGAIIKNLFVSGYLASTSQSLAGIAGSVGGTTENRVIISNCVFSGTVSSTSNMVGSIAGYAQNTTIENCYITAESEIKGLTGVGGIIGSAFTNTNVTSCYSLAKMSEGGATGGVTGAVVSSSVTNCAFLENTAQKVVGGVNTGTLSNVGTFGTSQVVTITDDSGSFSGNLLTLLRQDVGAGKWETKAGVNGGYPVLVAIK